MCGVFGQNNIIFRTSHFKKIKVEQIKDNSYIKVGNNASVITYNAEDLTEMTFGLTPFWADKRMYLFNARSEGKENQANEIDYNGNIGIFSMPSFRKSIIEKRCLVPASFFIEGTVKEKLKKPFKILRNDSATFLLGGIYDTWTDKSTGEIVSGFAVITTPASPLLQKLPHHRSPIVFEEESALEWLNPRLKKIEIEGMMKIFDCSKYEAIAL